MAADLKQDLLTMVVNDKNYDELELVRLASEPNMNYRLKVSQMYELIKKISTYNNSIELINTYFSEPAKATENPAPVSAPPVNGQSHSE